MAHHDEQRAHMTQPQPNHGESREDRSSSSQGPPGPKGSPNQRPRPNEDAPHRNQVDNEDPRQSEHRNGAANHRDDLDRIELAQQVVGRGDGAGSHPPFNPPGLKWHRHA
jgi:hypothetical protein